MSHQNITLPFCVVEQWPGAYVINTLDGLRVGYAEIDSQSGKCSFVVGEKVRNADFSVPVLLSLTGLMQHIEIRHSDSASEHGEPITSWPEEYVPLERGTTTEPETSHVEPVLEAVLIEHEVAANGEAMTPVPAEVELAGGEEGDAAAKEVRANPYSELLPEADRLDALQRSYGGVVPGCNGKEMDVMKALHLLQRDVVQIAETRDQYEKAYANRAEEWEQLLLAMATSIVVGWLNIQTFVPAGHRFWPFTCILLVLLAIGWAFFRGHKKNHEMLYLLSPATGAHCVEAWAAAQRSPRAEALRRERVGQGKPIYMADALLMKAVAIFDPSARMPDPEDTPIDQAYVQLNQQ